MDKILVIGANGQIGSVLTTKLAKIYGVGNIIASDIRQPKEEKGIFETLNILDNQRLSSIIRKYKITQIYHLAAILSAKGESNPLKSWDINMTGLFNVLEAARAFNIEKVFFPSSIAVFGPNTPRVNTPQDTIMTPDTVYGISKVAGEHWCNYYFQKYGLDIRSLRYPGVIGYQSLPGGGTTDYAVDIYHKAVQGEVFSCFLNRDTRLPMIYMDDAIDATIQLMDAPKKQISVRTSYNLASMSFTPDELYREIIKHIPSFRIEYNADFRQEIANSWPESIDDQLARKDWNWKPQFDIARMTEDMIKNLRKTYNGSKLELV